MAIYNYYGVSTRPSYYNRTYLTPVNILTTPTAFANVTDPVGTPDDILKMSPGTVYGTNETLTFTTNLDYSVTIESLSVSDWDIVLKEKWFKAWMTKVGLSNFINQPIFYTLFNDWEADFGFEKLSGLSIASVFQNPVTFEINIMVNVYENTFFQDWVTNVNNKNDYPTESALLFGSLIPSKHYISHVGKVTYGGYSDYVWSFSTKPFNFSNYVITSDFVNGGGNLFALIKLAGAVFKNNISVSKPHYLVIKNVPKDDPTKGFSTVNRFLNNEFLDYNAIGPYCIGDVLTVLNDSTITSRTNSTNVFQWTWYGELFNIPTLWYMADITNPCEDYRAVPVYDMLFPLRVISECKIEDFD